MNKTQELIAAIDTNELNRLFSWEFCELDSSFLCFSENYSDLAVLPKHFTILDIGSCQSFQAAFFKKHFRYIGVEPNVPIRWRLTQKNATYFEMTGQQFIEKMHQHQLLINEPIDVNNTFCILSAVPLWYDNDLQGLVQKTFPYYRIAYPGIKTIQNLP